MSEQDNIDRNPVPTDDEPDPILTSDGAVRQLEKADIIAHRGAGGASPDNADAQEVISLGKDPGGAPEENAADASDLTNQD